MVVVSILPHPKFGPDDNREDAPHFNFLEFSTFGVTNLSIQDQHMVHLVGLKLVDRMDQLILHVMLTSF